MNRLKNEKGYTLILVLIMMTVLVIFALALSGLAISTRMQFNKTDERNKATAIAEMGITYYKSILDRLSASANSYANSHSNSNSSYDSQFLTTIKTNPEVNVGYVLQNTLENQPDKSYKITVLSFADSLANNTIAVTFRSLGQTAKDSVTINSTITIQKSTGKQGIGQTSPTPSSYSAVEPNTLNLTAQNKDASYPSSTYFKGDINTQGSSNLTVQGNAFFLGSLYLQGSATVKIFGDAIFHSKLPSPTGKAYTLCITGDTYLVDAQNNLIDYPMPENSCVNTAIKGWAIDSKSGINVQY